LYVLEGRVAVELQGATHNLEAAGYAYVPSGTSHRVIASSASRVAVIEKKYVPVSGSSIPAFLTGSEAVVESQPS